MPDNNHRYSLEELFGLSTPNTDVDTPAPIGTREAPLTSAAPIFDVMENTAEKPAAGALPKLPETPISGALEYDERAGRAAVSQGLANLQQDIKAPTLKPVSVNPTLSKTDNPLEEMLRSAFDMRKYVKEHLDEGAAEEDKAREDDFRKALESRTAKREFLSEEDIEPYKVSWPLDSGEQLVEYQIGGDTLPEEVAHKYLTSYNDELLHEKRFRDDEEYRNDWFLQHTGITDKQYRENLADELDKELDKWEEQVKPTVVQNTRGGYAALGAAANQQQNSSYQIARKKLDDARAKVNTLRKNNFWSGLREGADLAAILTFDLSSIGDNVQLLKALNKESSGESLTKHEEALVKAWEIDQQAEEAIEMLGGRSIGTNIGSGAMQSIPFIGQMMLTGGVASAATKGISSAAAKAALKKSLATTTNRKIAEGLKLGSMKIAESAVGATARVPFSGSTYKNYTDKRLNQYQLMERMDDATGEIERYIGKKESSILRDAAHSALESFFEYQSEDVGGLFDYSIKAFAKSLPRKNIIRRLAVESVTGPVKSALPRWIKESAKIYSLGGEVLSEAYGDAMINLLTGNEDGWKHMATKDYWWELAGVSAMLSGSFAAMNRGINRVTGATKTRNTFEKARLRSLDGIQDESLRKHLFQASMLDDLTERSKMLANIDWESGYTREDMARAVDFITAQTSLDAMYYSEAEADRLRRMMPALAKIDQAANDKELNTDDLAEILGDTYAKAFRTQENQQDLNRIADRVRVAANAGISARDINDILAQAGLKVYAPGDEVETLAGVRGMVNNVLPGAYEIIDNNGNIGAFSFEEVLQPSKEVAEAQMANADQEVAAEEQVQNAQPDAAQQAVNEAVEAARAEVEQIKNQDDDIVYTVKIEGDDKNTGYIIKGAGLEIDSKGKIAKSDVGTVVVQVGNERRTVAIDSVTVTNATSVEDHLLLAANAAQGVVQGAMQAQQSAAQVPEDAEYEATLKDNADVFILKGQNIVYKDEENGQIDAEGSDQKIKVRYKDGAEGEVSPEDIDVLFPIEAAQAQEVATEAQPIVEQTAVEGEQQAVQAPNQTNVQPEQVAEQTVAPKPAIPTLKNGQPDYNAMTPEQFVEVFGAQHGENAVVQIANNNVKAAEKKITDIEKKQSSLTDPNDFAKNASQLEEAKALKAKYEKVLDIVSQRNAAPQVAEEAAQTAEQTVEPTEVVEAVEAVETPAAEVEQTAPTQEETETEEPTAGVVEEATSTEEPNATVEEGSRFEGITVEEQALFDKMAKALNVAVEYVDEINGGRANAEYVPSTRTLRVARGGRDKVARFLVGHEFTHRMQALAPQQYEEFAQAVVDYLGADFNIRVKRLREVYKAHGIKANTQLLRDEVVADFAGELAENRMLFDGFVNTDAVKNNPGLLERIMEVLRAIRDYFVENNASNPALDEAIGKLEALYSASVEAANSIESEGGQVDMEKGDALSSVKDILQGKQREKAIKDLMRVTGRSRATVERYLKAEESLAAIILDANNNHILDLPADDSLPSIWKNSDYPQGTVEFSNICRKRLPLTMLYQRLQKEFPLMVFDKYAIETMRGVLKANGVDVACGICFVEDRRQLLGEIGQMFIDMLEGNFTEANEKQNAAFEEMKASWDGYIPTLYDLLTLDGYKALKAKHPAVATAFLKFNNARGMQAGRLFQAYSAYHREILGYSKATVRSKNNNGGLRIFSFSDFEAHHLIDLVQILTDCAAKGLKVQGYTKVPEFARAVKDTNMKVNRSLISKGNGVVDANYVPGENEAVSPNAIGGKRLLLDTVEGIDVNHRNFFDSTDSKSVGNILVGINEEQIRLAMLDPFVDYIIPFHTGLSASVLKQKGIGEWVNYKNSQIEKVEVDGKLKNAPGHGINIYEEVLSDDIKTERQFVNRYLEVCREKGYIPKFPQFLSKNSKGKYIYTKGYYKFLIDFKLFDKNGKIIPQEAIVPVFDNELNKQILEDYVRDEKAKLPNEELYGKVKEALGLPTQYSLKMQPEKKVTFDDFFENTAAVYVAQEQAPEGTPNYTSPSGSRYWYGEDEQGKYVIRRSDHWSDRMTSDEAIDSFESNPGRYRNIASCYWGIDTRPIQKTLSEVSASDIRRVNYNSSYHILNITFRGGGSRQIRGVEPSAMRAYYESVKLGDMEGAKMVVEEVANQERNLAIQTPIVIYGKAYLSDFTKFERENTTQYSLKESNKATLGKRSDADSHNSLSEGLPLAGSERLSGMALTPPEDFAKIMNSTERAKITATKLINEGGFKREIDTPSQAVSSIGNALHMKKSKSSQSYYGDYFEGDYTVEGNIVHLRVSTHPAAAYRIGNKRADHKVSIVVLKNGEHKNSQEPHGGYEEFIYDPSKVKPSEAAEAIVVGIKSLLETGVYTDVTGKAIRKPYPYTNENGEVFYSIKEDGRASFLENQADDAARAYVNEQMDIINKMDTARLGERAYSFERMLARGGSERDLRAYETLTEYAREAIAERPDKYEAHEYNLKDGEHGVEILNELFHEFNTSKETEQLFSYVYPAAKRLGISVRVQPMRNWGEHYQGIVALNGGFFNSDIVPDSRKAEVILHELIHSVTTNAVYFVENPSWQSHFMFQPNENLKAAVKNIKDIYNDIAKSEEFEDEYGVKNVHEFMAELSNPQFVEKLKKHNLWTEIVDAIKRIVSAFVPGGIYSSSNAHKEAMDALEKIVENMPSEKQVAVNYYWQKKRPYEAMNSSQYSLKGDAVERAKIERTAKANGTWLKAPNGKQTNLPSEQWVTTRTKAFKNWAGDWENDPENATKILDENGEPKIVWHGGDFAIDNFVPYGEMHFGTFAAAKDRLGSKLVGSEGVVVEENSNGEYEWMYVDDYDTEYDKKGDKAFATKDEAYRDAFSHLAFELKPYFLNIRSVERVSDQNTDWDGVIAEAKAKNHDGLAYENQHEDAGSESYIAFYPNQIKSAEGNTTFDPNNDDTRYSLKSNVETEESADIEVGENIDAGPSQSIIESEKAQKALTRLNKVVRQFRAKLNKVAKENLDWGTSVATALEKEVGSGELLSFLEMADFISNIRGAISEKSVDKALETLSDKVLTKLIAERKKNLKQLMEVEVQRTTPAGIPIAHGVDNATRQVVGTFNILKKLGPEQARKHMEEISDKDMPGHLKAEVMQLHTLWMLIQDEETNLEVLKQKLDRAHEESVSWYRTARALKGLKGREKEREEALAMRRTHIAEIRRIEPLMTATKQQLADDYASIVEQFADRIMVGRAAQKRKIDEERKYAQRFGIEALKDVDTGRARKTYEYSAEEKKEKKKDERLRDIRLSMHGSLKYMIESVSTNAIGGRGFIYHEMILGDNGWVACRDNELQMNLDCNLEILKRANTAGFKTVDDMRRAFDDALVTRNGEHAIVTIKTERTGRQSEEKVALTVGNATYLVLMWNQPDIRPTLERMNIDEETIMGLHEMLPAYAKNFIEWSVDMLEERLEKVYSPASVQMYGTSMDKNLNYFPVRRVKEDTYHAPVDITDPNVAPDDNKKVVNTSTALIRRKANLVQVQILVNPMEVLGKHLEEMNHFATFVPFTRNANILLSAPGFREQLDMQDEWGHGLNTYDNFKQAVLVAAGNYQPATDKISKVLNEVQGLVAAGKIAWRFFTAAKQILSLPAFASYSTDPKYWKIFTKNILTTAWWKRGESGRMSTWKWCYENLPTYKQRWDSKYAGDEKLSTVEATAMARALDRSMAGRAIKDFFGKYGMLANAAVDAFTCSIGAYSIYEYELQRYQNEEGMSKEEADKMAKRRAEIGFNQSQQSSELLFLAPSQLDKTFAATYASLFENSNRAYGRIERVGREQIVRSFDKKAVAKQLDLAKNRYAKKLRDAERARLKAENEKISDFSKRLTEEQIEKAVNEKRAAFDIQAEKMAKRDMNRAKKNAVADVVVFRYLLNILWSISPSLAQSVAFIGSDDDENPESWDWAFWANNILQAHLRNGVGGATIGSILSGFGAQSMLEADLNKLIDTAMGIGVKIDEDGEEKTTIDWQAFWETAKLVYAMGTGINLETFSNMYNAVCMVINDGSLDAEDVALFLNSPKSIIEAAAIRPDEGESQEDYIKRIAFMKGLASKVETAQKKQEMNSEGIVEELTDAEKSALTNLKKWQKNYIDIKTARALGLQWQRNRYNGRVEIPELNKLDKQYKDMLKMLGRTPSLNKVEKEKRYIYPEDVQSRIDEAVERLDVMKRLRNIRGLEQGRELNVVKNNDYEALTRQWYDAKKSLVEDWKNYQIK